MDFLSKLLQGISFLPALINGIESFLGSRPGAEKKEAALAFVQNALSVGDAIAKRQIVDENKFKNGLGQIIDGTVECLNASVWRKTDS